MSVLIIIPARGDSKGIPRKNLRPLANKPLIYYSIKAALGSGFKPDVYVTSEDQEILVLAKKFKAKTYNRSKKLAEDITTLDPVIYDAYKAISKLEKKTYKLIVTLQPTSPLLNTSTLDEAISQMINNSQIDTLLSAVDDTHLTWSKGEKGFIPNYKERINRQYLPVIYKETGGFLITRDTVITENNRIGNNTQLFVINNSREAIDIDCFEDWNICEYFLKRKIILFSVAGYPEIGLGHIYNTLIVANEIVHHRLIFLVDSKSKLGFKKIQEDNYEVHMQSSDNIIDDIIKFKPNIVINDRLDTTIDYMKQLKGKNIKLINIEDLGKGAKLADVVINAMYPEKEKLANHYFGPEYFCAREEFLHTPKKKLTKSIKNILISFGGVDPNNLTYKVLNSIYDLCCDKKIEINIITGLGYNKYNTLQKFKNIKIYKHVRSISEFMYNADIVFTSAGRTTYELALIGIPSIILTQNERELSHFFADKKHGFMNLGLGDNVEESDILDAFEHLIANFKLRNRMQKLMLKNDIVNGRKRVLKIIKQIIDDE